MDQSAPGAPPPTPPTPPTPPAPVPTIGGHHGSPKITQRLLVTGLVLVLAVAAYLLGASTQKAAAPADTTDPIMAKVSVPQDAVVSAECVNGRGKQYVLSQDIPNGPLYDVNEGKVVAIEYLVAAGDVKATPAKYLDLNLHKVEYDHLNITTVGTAVANQQQLNIVVALVPQAELDAIKCGSAVPTTPPTNN